MGKRSIRDNWIGSEHTSAFLHKIWEIIIGYEFSVTETRIIKINSSLDFAPTAVVIKPLIHGGNKKVTHT